MQVHQINFSFCLWYERTRDHNVNFTRVKSKEFIKNL